MEVIHVKHNFLSIASISLLSLSACCAQRNVKTGSVIFIHPDGTSAATWTAARALYHGPDGELNWDRLPAMAVYREHTADRLTPSSNSGGTTHAYGVKVALDAFGRTAGGERGRDIVDAEGRSLSVAKQAICAGIPVGFVQTGTSTEPGTACFVASVESRQMHDEIASQLLASGAKIILGGGEQFFLPAGVEGVHGPGKRTDGRNLIEEAKSAGFTVVRTREELLALDAGTERVLGLFAAYHTFHDSTEEALVAAGLPAYEPDAPTVAEMTEVALQLLAAKEKPFLLIVEEEGTDNFGNFNNAAGMIQAMGRADDAIGVARGFVQTHGDTLLLTAADSDAGGMRMFGYRTDGKPLAPDRLPACDSNGAPLDGCTGTGSAPFLAAPDCTGKRLPFGIVWASKHDVSGGVLVRAEGLNAHLVSGSVDNTEIAEIMRATLFGSDAPSPR
jgi:alkaline phosphatase